MKRFFSAGVLLTTLVSGAQAQNLLVNGSFETDGSKGWDMSGNGFSVLSQYGATDGVYAIEFAEGDNGPFQLEQHFTGVAGVRYNVGFDWKTSHPTYQSTEFSIVGAGGTLASLTVSGQYAGPFNAASPFQHFATSFVADGTALTIRFVDASPTSFQADQLIDNVSVSAVPEPASYAMLFAGLGLLGVAARRKASR